MNFYTVYIHIGTLFAKLTKTEIVMDRAEFFQIMQINVDKKEVLKCFSYLFSYFVYS